MTVGELIERGGYEHCCERIEAAFKEEVTA